MLFHPFPPPPPPWRKCGPLIFWKMYILICRLILKHVCRIQRGDRGISKRCLFYHFYIFYMQKLFIQIHFSELWIYFSALCNDVIFLFKSIAKDSCFYRIFFCEDWALYILKWCVKLMSKTSANRLVLT